MARDSVCVVVAHPDDEALWFGGGLFALQRARARTVVVSLTNGGNRVRAAEFAAACAEVDALGLMLDYPDGGHARLPDYPSELTPLLVEHGVAPDALGCVLTHSPLGNERGHPQHVQTWEAIRAWSLHERVGLGFFAERRLPAVREGGRTKLVAPGVTLRRGRMTSSDLVRRAVSGLARRPWDLNAHHLLVLEGSERYRRFRTVTHVFSVSVDRDAKAALLDCYPSQPGVRDYEAFGANEERAYVLDRGAAAFLEKAFACPSS